MVDAVCSKFDKVILVLNTANAMELDFLRENRQWLAQAIKVHISTDEMNCLAVLLRQAGKSGRSRRSG